MTALPAVPAMIDPAAGVRVVSQLQAQIIRETARIWFEVNCLWDGSAQDGDCDPVEYEGQRAWSAFVDGMIRGRVIGPFTFGRGELRDWFERQPDGSIIGMGQTINRGGDGRIDYVTAPQSTGVRLFIDRALSDFIPVQPGRPLHVDMDQLGRVLREFIALSEHRPWWSRLLARVAGWFR